MINIGCVCWWVPHILPSIMDDNSKFEYTRFWDSEAELRLIRLLPGNNTELDLVQCQIRTFSKLNRPPYGAVSYRWGTEVSREFILLNQKEFTVTLNVRRFLSALQNVETRWIWIESICIDQRHKYEKGPQVQKMGEIYTEAEEVLLLPESDSRFIFSSWS
jgi:hypothetical protein